MRSESCIKSSISHKRLPPWMQKKFCDSRDVLRLKKIIRENRLHTVCQSAGCPNISECFAKPTATFMILGNTCTRSCSFCGVEKGLPDKVDAEEPKRIARAVYMLQLKHVVITSVTRDDLSDGGARQFVQTVHEIHRILPDTTIEVLIPDFQGHIIDVRKVMRSGIDILNHNIETIPRLYRKIRPEADINRSLMILKEAKAFSSQIITKSGLMVGLGETWEEMILIFKELADIGCDALTIGQYLAPNKGSYPVQEYVTPEMFKKYGVAAKNAGIPWVASDPYVRSSYNADKLLARFREVSV